MTSRGRGSIHHLRSKDFSSLVPGALANVELRGALAKGTSLVQNRRDSAAASVPEWEILRNRAEALKADVLSNLADHLEMFERNATRNGAQVHWAADAEEANAIITSIARNAGATVAVKSKSMASEEIGLNEALERDGIQPIETDLGEWIVQIAGEAPSHIVAPALHKSREEIRRLFEAVLNRPMPEDAEGLTEVARQELRQAFVDAEIGITGVNFLIEETGSLLILENEGNIRMTTSMPRVHVALAGIEKIIPRLADLDVFLRLIGRSGTGQTMTSYQSLITGTKGLADDDGPEELHIVLLDNGRSDLLGDPVSAQTLACIRCGACLNTCPVYRQIGGHAYGSVYPGPIGSILTPQLVGMHNASQLPYASSLCGACRDVCPVKIDIPEILLALRARIVEGRPEERDATTNAKLRSERSGFAIWAWAMNSPRRYRIAGGIARLGASFANHLPTFAAMLGPLGAWAQGRAVPRPPRRTLRAELRRHHRRTK